MANLNETPVWPEGIYQIEEIDRVQGGPGGTANVQASQLANRTAYLKEKADALAAPGGAAMIGQGVMAVGSIADLLALPAGQRKEGLRYLVKGYHAGSGIGGGEFKYVASRSEENDGGTVFDGFVRDLSRGVTAADFGCVCDRSADDWSRLQAFFDFACSNYTVQAGVYGDLNISQTITIAGNATRNWDFDARIYATAPMEVMLDFVTFRECDCSGKLETWGQGGIGNISTYTVKFGMRHADSARTKFEYLRGGRFIINGIDIDSFAASNNCSMMDLGAVRFSDCGAACFSPTTTASATYSNRVDSGASGGFQQRTTLTVTSLPPNEEKIRDTCIAVIDGQFYQILGYDDDLSTVSIFPWVDLNAPATGTIEYIYGAAVSIRGTDSAMIKFDLLDSARSGTALQDMALYGIVGQRLLSQANGIAYRIGRRTDGAHVSSSLRGLYTEQDRASIVLVSNTADTNAHIDTAYALSFDKCHVVCAPRYSSNALVNGYASFSNVSISKGARRGLSSLWCGNSGRFGNGADSSSTLDLAPDGSPGEVYTRNTWTVRLAVAGQEAALYGHTSKMLTVIGPTASAPSGAITFNPADPSWTVNGLESQSFTGFTKGALFGIYWNIEGKDIRVELLS